MHCVSEYYFLSLPCLLLCTNYGLKEDENEDGGLMGWESVLDFTAGTTVGPGNRHTVWCTRWILHLCAFAQWYTDEKLCVDVEPHRRQMTMNCRQRKWYNAVLYENNRNNRICTKQTKRNRIIQSNNIIFFIHFFPKLKCINQHDFYLTERKRRTNSRSTVTKARLNKK